MSFWLSGYERLGVVAFYTQIVHYSHLRISKPVFFFIWLFPQTVSPVPVARIPPICCSLVSQLKQARDAKMKALENDAKERQVAKKKAEQEVKDREAAKKTQLKQAQDARKKAKENARKEREAEQRRAEEAKKVKRLEPLQLPSIFYILISI